MAEQAPVTDQAQVPPEASVLPRRISARRGGMLAAGALALTGLLFAWQAWFLDLGGVGLPGPGFFPLALGLLLVVFSAAIGVDCWLARVKDEPVEFGHPQVLITFAALLVVPLLFEPLGAYIALGLLSAVLLAFIARVSLVLTVVWSVLGMAACWYLFQELLGVRLPIGPF